MVCILKSFLHCKNRVNFHRVLFVKRGAILGQTFLKFWFHSWYRRMKNNPLKMFGQWVILAIVQTSKGYILIQVENIPISRKNNFPWNFCIFTTPMIINLTCWNILWPYTSQSLEISLGDQNLFKLHTLFNKARLDKNKCEKWVRISTHCIL